MHYPLCPIIDPKMDEDNGSRHTIHTYKNKSLNFKCNGIVLDYCVAVYDKN